jgi:hypothetical protein
MIRETDKEIPAGGAAALFVVRRSLAASVYVRFAYARMFFPTITHVNGSYAGFEAISLVGFFECVDEATSLEFRWRDSNRDWHGLPFSIQNRADILA